MNKTQEMIQQNNELREQLEPENKKYYEDLMEYVRYGSNFKNDNKIEEILLQVLQDLIMAQEDGISAEAYFGKDPKESANDLLSSLDNDWLMPLKMFGVVLATYFFMSFAAANLEIAILDFLISALVITICLLIIFKLMQKNVYDKKANGKQNKINSLLTGCLLFLMFSFELFVEINIWVINLPYLPVAGIVLFISLTVTGLFFKQPKGKRDFWLLGVIALWGAFFMGMGNHVLLPVLINM